jgi:transmembrane sensor
VEVDNDVGHFRIAFGGCAAPVRLQHINAMTTHHAIHEQAAQRYAQTLDGPLSDAQEAALETWLALDVRHRLAYADVTAAGYALEQLAPHSAPKRRAVPTWRPWLAGAIALPALLLLLLRAPHAVQDWRSDAHTAVGLAQTQTLPDGSILQLDSDSAVTLDFSAGRREVTLLRGALAVRVVKDPAHPFRVHCADTQVTALGTRFLVRRLEHGVDVGITEGRIALQSAHAAKTQDLVPGQHALLDDSADAFAVDVLAASDDSWTRGALSFDRVPLHDAVQQLARYLPQHVVLRAPFLADRPVTASLPLADAQAALDSLAHANGLRVQRWPGLIVIAAP